MKNIYEIDEYLEKFLSEKFDFDTSIELIKDDLKKNNIILDFLNKYDFHSDYLEFINWLKQLIWQEPIPEGIIALNFGLFESEESLTLYISGSTEWDQGDSDWATNNDYFPEGRYFHLSILSEISGLLKEEGTAHVGIYLTLAMIISFINQLRKESDIKFSKEIVHIATGFDDGDLYNIF